MTQQGTGQTKILRNVFTRKPNSDLPTLVVSLFLSFLRCTKRCTVPQNYGCMTCLEIEQHSTDMPGLSLTPSHLMHAASLQYSKILTVQDCPEHISCNARARLGMLTLLRGGSVAEAEQYFRQSLERDCHHVESLDGLCYILLRSRPEEARLLHKRLCTIKPSHSVVRCPYANFVFARASEARDTEHYHDKQEKTFLCKVADTRGGLTLGNRATDTQEGLIAGDGSKVIVQEADEGGSVDTQGRTCRSRDEERQGKLHEGSGDL